MGSYARAHRIREQVLSHRALRFGFVRNPTLQPVAMGAAANRDHAPHQPNSRSIVGTLLRTHALNTCKPSPRTCLCALSPERACAAGSGLQPRLDFPVPRAFGTLLRVVAFTTTLLSALVGCIALRAGVQARVQASLLSTGRRRGMPSCGTRRLPRSARVRSSRCGRQRVRAQAANRGELRSAGPEEPPPDYTNIDRQPLNRAIMALFRAKMVPAIGRDSELQGYDAIIDLTRTLNSQHKGAQFRGHCSRSPMSGRVHSWVCRPAKLCVRKWPAACGAARSRQSSFRL